MCIDGYTEDGFTCARTCLGECFIPCYVECRVISSTDFIILNNHQCRPTVTCMCMNDYTGDGFTCTLVRISVSFILV